MGGRRCCCLGCIILEDDFDRTDSTNIGGEWVEEDAVWEIDTNRLIATGEGIIRTSRSHPKNDPTGYIEVDLPNIKSGDKYYIIIDYIYDELTETETYLWGAYEWNGGANAELSVGETTGGVDTVWDTVEISVQSDGGDPPTYYDTLIVCRPEDGIYCGVKSDSTKAWECGIGDNDGRKAGLRAGSLGGAKLEFDNFLWWEHYHTNTDCPACACDCEDWCVPPYMQMTFVTVDDEGNELCEPCGSLNGVSAISSRPYNASEKEYDFVFYDLPYGIPTGCTVDDSYGFVLHCPQTTINSCEDWFLSMGGSASIWHQYFDHQPGDCSWDTSNEARPCECECNPMILKFGPFYITTESGPCLYYIYITPYYPP